jgi:hypothetical protein
MLTDRFAEAAALVIRDHAVAECSWRWEYGNARRAAARLATFRARYRQVLAWRALCPMTDRRDISR